MIAATPFALAAVLLGAAGPNGPAGSKRGACYAPGPEYYAIDLVTTKNVRGTGLARGRADIALAPSSPFSVALSPDGSYRYQVHISLERMRAPQHGVLVAWVTTRDVTQVQRLGRLDDNLQITGVTSWNKFLVVVTLESEDEPDAQRWTGPVALRGMSRSGMMHTMAGHGAFQVENCAAYGYED